MYEDILSNIIITNTPKVFNLRVSSRHYRHDTLADWIITYVYAGELLYHSGSDTYVVNADNVLIQPNGSDYRWCCTETGRFISIRFDSGVTWNSLFCIPIKKHEKILSAFQKAEHIQESQDPMRKIKLLQSTYSILQMLINSEHPYVPTGKQNRVLPAYEYIATHYNQQIRNDYLAQLCGLSTAHFRKLFTDIYGRSPFSYAQDLRLSKAKELLKSDYLSVSDIALSLGYNNIYEFSKMFKKCYGVSPIQFIKEWREGTL